MARSSKACVWAPAFRRVGGGHPSIWATANYSPQHDPAWCQVWRTPAGPIMGSFDLPEHFKHTLGTPLRAAREGCMELHTVEIEGKDVRDYVIKSELDLQQALIGIVPSRTVSEAYLWNSCQDSRFAPHFPPWHGATSVRCPPHGPANGALTAMGKRSTGADASTGNLGIHCCGGRALLGCLQLPTG